MLQMLDRISLACLALIVSGKVLSHRHCEQMLNRHIMNIMVKDKMSKKEKVEYK